jgi:hypothetical protein
MSFLSDDYPSKKDINEAERIAQNVLERLIETLNVKNDRDAFHKDELKRHYMSLKTKMEEEKKRIRCEDYSLRHMVDIADILRAVIRHKTETNAADINDALLNQEKFYIVMRFIASCHKSKSKWEGYEVQKDTIYMIHEDLYKI